MGKGWPLPFVCTPFGLIWRPILEHLNPEIDLLWNSLDVTDGLKDEHTLHDYAPISADWNRKLYPDSELANRISLSIWTWRPASKKLYFLFMSGTSMAPKLTILPLCQS